MKLPPIPIIRILYQTDVRHFQDDLLDHKGCLYYLKQTTAAILLKLDSEKYLSFVCVYVCGGFFLKNSDIFIQKTS